MKKRYIFIFILLSIFVMPLNTKAVENPSLGLTIGDGKFYSLTSYPGWQDIGFQLPNSVSSDSLWTAIPTDTAHSYGLNGGALSQCGMSFVKDFYYSVSYNFLVSSWENFLHPGYSSWSSDHLVNICKSKSCTPNYSLVSVSSGQELIKYDDNYSIGSFTIIFKAPSTGSCVSIAFSSYNKSTNVLFGEFVGYSYQSLGSAPLSQSDIKNALSSDFNNLSTKIEDMKSEQQKTNSKLDSTNSKLDSANSKIDSTNSKLDNISSMTPDSSDSPDSSSYDSYSSAEDNLLKKAGEADLDSLEIPIDSSSSNFIWDTMSSLLNSHPLIISTLIAVLSIGIIKLVFAR